MYCSGDMKKCAFVYINTIILLALNVDALCVVVLCPSDNIIYNT